MTKMTTTDNRPVTIYLGDISHPVVANSIKVETFEEGKYDHIAAGQYDLIGDNDSILKTILNGSYELDQDILDQKDRNDSFLLPGDIVRIGNTIYVYRGKENWNEIGEATSAMETAKTRDETAVEQEIDEDIAQDAEAVEELTKEDESEETEPEDEEITAEDVSQAVKDVLYRSRKWYVCAFCHVSTEDNQADDPQVVLHATKEALETHLNERHTDTEEAEELVEFANWLKSQDTNPLADTSFAVDYIHRYTYI